MTPQLGDIVLNRYALVALLRNEPGLQVWQANDRILAHDCQLFIVNDTNHLPEVNAIASILALSARKAFTQVLQLAHQDQVAVIITDLDAGMSLSEYFHQQDVPLSYEIVRSIIANVANAVSTILTNGLSHYAISTDTVRLTNTGIELADTPVSPMLTDITHISEDMRQQGHVAPHDLERLATYQIAALLYNLLTHSTSQETTLFDISQLPEDIPAEFRMICQRGLAHETYNTVPMASLAELLALLGTAQHLHTLLREHGFDRLIRSGEQSIATVRCNPAQTEHLIIIPDDLAQSEQELSIQPSQQVPSESSPQNAKATPSSDDVKSIATTGAASAASSVAMAASLKNASKTLGALFKHSISKKSDSSANSEETKDTDFHDIAAAEMANILAPADLDADDSVFHSLSERKPIRVDDKPRRIVPENSHNADPHMQYKPTQYFSTRTDFDFAHLSHAHHPESDDVENMSLNDFSHSLETDATGRVPVVDINGHFVAPGEESARSLQEDDLEDTSTQISLPPSFQPREQVALRLKAEQERERERRNNIANAKIFGSLSTKFIAFGACAILLILGLYFGLVGLLGSFNIGSVDTNNTWTSEDIKNVPFGSQGVLPEEKQPVKQSPKNMAKRTVPKPEIPKNTTAYPIDRQQFLTRPSQQPGYGYYIHLTKPELVSRFVIGLRTSGGHAFLLANTKDDPRTGKHLAEFTFDASGTTEVKFTPTTTQDLFLWVPLDSLPNNSLYINSVKVY